MEAAQQLTDRERQVLAMLGRGMTRREIAAALFRSDRTIDAHQRNMKEKLGLLSVAALRVYAVQSAAC